MKNILLFVVATFGLSSLFAVTLPVGNYVGYLQLLHSPVQDSGTLTIHSDNTLSAKVPVLTALHGVNGTITGTAIPDAFGTGAVCSRDLSFVAYVAGIPVSTHSISLKKCTLSVDKKTGAPVIDANFDAHIMFLSFHGVLHFVQKKIIFYPIFIIVRYTLLN